MPELMQHDGGYWQFPVEPLWPMHIFTRFSGESRHDALPNESSLFDPLAEDTPAAGAASLINALWNTSATQRAAMTVNVMWNGDVASRRLNFWREHLEPLGLGNYSIVEVPHGNQESYNGLLGQVLQIQDEPQATVMLLEEDYIFHPSTFSRLAELWNLYNPCTAVPHHDPEFFVHRKPSSWQPNHEESVVLHTPGMYWRNVSWTPGAIMMRLDVFHYLQSRDILPDPAHDAEHSILWAREMGLWAPMPALATHMHLDTLREPIDPMLTHFATMSDDFDFVGYAANLTQKAIDEGWYDEEERTPTVALSSK
jgi:hypothetical protein